jgi:hypothetical protein
MTDWLHTDGLRREPGGTVYVRGFGVVNIGKISSNREVMAGFCFD